MARPYTVILDLTERCNLSCVMCYFSATDRLGFKPYDRTTERGLLPVDVFEAIACDVFSQAHTVALGCAAEPMLHPKFTDILQIAGRYSVPNLWFPSNLLPLSERGARAIVDNNVTTVAASIDGVTEATYERIRIGGRFSRLLSKLDLFNQARGPNARADRSKPQLRIIFTWMQSNRDELRALPAFAERHGARELDVRFVTRTEGVDVTPELLDDEPADELRADLRATAEDALARGLKLSSFPEFDEPGERPSALTARLKRRVDNLRLGLEQPKHWQQRWREGREGCVLPARTLVVRPNGAVSPCVFWQSDPIGFYPEHTLAEIQSGDALTSIRTGLRSGNPVGSCVTCSSRRDAFYRPLRRRLHVLTGDGAQRPTNPLGL